MNDSARERLAWLWEEGGHKVVGTVLGFGHGIAFWLILKSSTDYDTYKSFGLVTWLAGFFVGGIEYLLIDAYLVRGKTWSMAMKIAGVVAVLAAFGLAFWNASEEWKSRQPRQEPDFRKQLREIERQQRQ